MRTFLRTIITLCLVFPAGWLLAEAATPQDSGRQVPDAAKLLAQANQVLARHQSVQFVSEWTWEQKSEQGSIKSTQRKSVYFAAPAKLRMETTTDISHDIAVVDGECTWIYEPGPNVYMKRAVVLAAPRTMNASSDLSIQGASEPRVTKEAMVKMDGRQRPTWVIEIAVDAPKAANPAEGTVTYYVDQEWGIIIQYKMSLKFTGKARTYDAVEDKMQIRDFKLDQPVADSLFSFTPPKNAKEVPVLGNLTLPWSNLTGHSALDVAVKTKEGATYTSAALKGKTVLVVFVTDWCAPCRDALPVLDALARNHKDDGLIVLRSNAEDNPDAADKYQVTAFPTYVLIDPNGRINTYSVGFTHGPEVVSPPR